MSVALTLVVVEVVRGGGGERQVVCFGDRRKALPRHPFRDVQQNDGLLPEWESSTLIGNLKLGHSQLTMLHFVAKNA